MIKALKWSERGLSCSPVFIAVFGGLCWIVVSLSIIENLPLSPVTRHWVLAFNLPIAGLAVIAVLTGFRSLIRKRFENGHKESLFLLSMVNKVLKSDCSQLQSLLGGADRDLARVLTECFGQGIAPVCTPNSGATAEIQKGGSGIRSNAWAPEASDRLPDRPACGEREEIPQEMKLITTALTLNYPDLSILLELVQLCRERLFTSLNSSRMPASQAAIKAVTTDRQIELEAPDAPHYRKIQARQKEMAKMQSVHANSPDDTHLGLVQRPAENHSAILIEVIGDYKRAWRELIDAYDAALPPRTGT